MLRFRASVAVLAILIAAIPISGAVSAPKRFDFSRVDRLLSDSLRTIAGSAGGLALLVWKDGKLIYDKAYVLPGKRFSKETVVPVASATKLVSSAMLMAMVDRKKISLDDSLGAFFNPIPIEKSSIKIRHLLSHTSGIADAFLIREETPCLTDWDINLEKCAVEILGLGQAYSPGNKFIYGNHSMQVSGRVMELAFRNGRESGDSWNEAFNALFAGPLSMDSSRFASPVGSPQNPLIGGGVLSNASDYLKFLEMLLNRGVYRNKRILSESSVDEILRNQIGDAEIVFSPYSRIRLAGFEPGRMKHGLGCWIIDADSSGRGIEVVTQGIFGFSGWIDRSRNLAGVLSVYGDFMTTFPTFLSVNRQVKKTVDAVK